MNDSITVGDAAFALQEMLDEISSSRGILGSRVFALAGLDRAAHEARVDGWDGYEGVPLDRASYEAARRILLRLDSRIPTPEVDADPRGGVVLTWSPTPDRDFVVAIRESGSITYAGRFGDSTVHGREPRRDRLQPAILFALFQTIAPDPEVS